MNRKLNMKSGIQAGITMEAAEMVGKATTISVSEMDAEKKQKLGLALDRVVQGGLQEKSMAGLDFVRQTFGLSIANGVERAQEALTTVRHDAETNRGFAIAKGVVNVPAQIMRGIVADTVVEVGSAVAERMRQPLPDLPENIASHHAKKSKEFSKARDI